MLTSLSTPEHAPKKPAAMRAANIFTGFVFALWGGQLWLGIGLMKNMAAGQIRFWIDAPAGMLALLLFVFVIFNFVKRSGILLAVAALLAIGPLLFYLFALRVAMAA